MLQVRAEVSVQDQHIKALQGQLKEAETLLASTIYQAKQKLANISRSSPVLSEDLIKYSHRISASNAVCAPLNWQQGDPRYNTKYNLCPSQDFGFPSMPI